MQANIDHIADSFATWRATREKRGNTPLHLKQLAVSLIGKHTQLLITTRLGVNNRMLNHWQSELNNQTLPTFIDITPVPSQSLAPLSVAMDLRSGSQLKLAGSAHDIAALLLRLQQGGGL